MAVAYGFYNSSSGDRTYDAKDLGQLFDGLISDGVYANVGNALMVSPNSPTGMSIRVDTGRAWFKGTWTTNNSIMSIPVTAANSVYTRIDAVILKVDMASRVNSFLVKAGTASSSPVEPVLTQSGNIWEFALASITIPPGTTSITSANIRNYHGTANMPFVTNIMPSIDVSSLFQQWSAQHDAWAANTEAAFATWFSNLQVVLNGDVAATLANKVANLESQIANLNMYAVANSVSGAAKRLICRGNDLGYSVSASQKTAIQNGSFVNMFVGDYWTINGVRWRIVDLDYWYKKGTPALNSHHVVLMPDTNLYQQRMNSKDVTTSGYTGSEMFSSGLTPAINAAVSAFGSNSIPTRYVMLDHNTIKDSGIPYNTYEEPLLVEIPTEEMITGLKVASTFGRIAPRSISGFPATAGNRQLAIYQVMGIRPDNENLGFWLRDTASPYDFACIYLNGDIGIHNASKTYGVRPVFAMTGV